MKKISVYSREIPLETSATRRDSMTGMVSWRVSDELHGFDIHTLNPNASEDKVAAFLAQPPHKAFDELVAETRQSVNAELAMVGWPPGNEFVLVAEDGWEIASPHDLETYCFHNSITY